METERGHFPHVSRRLLRFSDVASLIAKLSILQLSIARIRFRLLSSDSGGLQYLWEPPKYAIAPKPIAVADNSQVEIDGDRKTSRKKRKRAQQDAGAHTAPMDADQANLLVSFDSIYATCLSPVQQGLDYPQHEGCVPILQAALARLSLLQMEPKVHAEPLTHAPEPDSFERAMDGWKGPTPAEAPIAWERPFINEQDSPIKIDSASTSWYIPRSSAFLMVRSQVR